MSKPIEKRPVSYDAEVWARKKYGPTLKQAKIIISSSGLSSVVLTFGAAAFIRIW